MQIYNCEQRSPEWFDCRKGKMTASNAQAIANNGKGLETYIYSLMAEKYSINTEEGYCGTDMQRGIDLEAQARETYEIMYESVQEVGAIEYNEYFLASPDGLVGEDGLIEIKCPSDANFFRIMIDGEKAIDSKYMWQMQGQMLASGRKWVDFVAYNPHFEKNMLVFRIEADTEKQEKLLLGIDKGKELIKKIEEKLNS